MPGMVEGGLEMRQSFHVDGLAVYEEFPAAQTRAGRGESGREKT